MRRVFAFLITLIMAGTAQAENHHCVRETIDGHDYSICRVGPDADLRLFSASQDGLPWGRISRLRRSLSSQGYNIDFAMNAGMYHNDLSPVGLYIEEGVEKSRIVTSDGPGNFGLLPNGVFCIMPKGDKNRFRVIEARQFEDNPPLCQFATQSGPMLVIDGARHPRFREKSDSYFIRNGVGIDPETGDAVFIISHQPVNFYRFSSVFIDKLNINNALFFDGKISQLYTNGVGGRWSLWPVGPIVALLSKNTEVNTSE